jgi:hypothetical protein
MTNTERYCTADREYISRKELIGEVLSLRPQQKALASSYITGAMTALSSLTGMQPKRSNQEEHPFKGIITSLVTTVSLQAPSTRRHPPYMAQRTLIVLIWSRLEGCTQVHVCRAQHKINSPLIYFVVLLTTSVAGIHLFHRGTPCDHSRSSLTSVSIYNRSS